MQVMRMKPIICFYLFISLPFFCKAQTYYILNENGSLNTITDGNPAQVQADEWQIRLYRCTGAEGWWGVITGDSADEVTAELKKQQEDEKKYCKWATQGNECLYGQLCVFRPFGPIAVIRNRSLSQKMRDYFDELSDIGGQLNDLRNEYNNMAELVEGTREITPFDNIGITFREYADNLRDARVQLADLHRMSTMIDGLELQTVENLFKEFDKLTDKIESSNSKLTTMLHSGGASNSSNGWELVRPQGGGLGTIKYTLRLNESRIESVTFASNYDGSRSKLSTYSFPYSYVDKNSLIKKINEFKGKTTDFVQMPGYETTYRLAIPVRGGAEGSFFYEETNQGKKITRTKQTQGGSEMFFETEQEMNDCYNQLIGKLNGSTQKQTNYQQQNQNTQSNPITNNNATSTPLQNQTTQSAPVISNNDTNVGNEAYAAGSNALDQKDYQTALESYNEAEKLGIRNEGLYLGRGLANSELKNHKDAINDFSKAIQFEPTKPIYFTLRAISYDAIGDIDKAIRDFDSAIELDPNEKNLKIMRDHAISKTNNSSDKTDRTNNGSNESNSKFMIRNNNNNKSNFELSPNQSNWTSFSLNGLSQSDYWYPNQQQSFFRITTTNSKTKVYKIEAGRKYKIEWNATEQCWDLFSDGVR